jgi:hypothetical protein
MNEGTSFGFNNHSIRWILRYLLNIKTKYLIFSRYNLHEIKLENYLTNGYTQQFFDSILEREDTLKDLKEFLPKPKKGLRLQDIVKLFGNEIIITEQSRSTFFQFPL